jgi:hypothetical protein
MTYRIYRFGTTVLPDYNEESNIGLITSGKSALDLPSGGALDLFGGERVMPGSAKILKICTLHATTESSLLTQFIALRVLVGTRSELYRLIIADDHLEWVFARFDNLDVMRKYGQNSRLFQDVKLSFTVYSPAWYSEGTHNYSGSVSPSEPDDLTTVLAESGATKVLHIDHSGNIDQPAVIFTITAIGNVTLVTINNPTTGYSFSYNGALASGNVLVIDTGAMSVQNNEVDDYAHFLPPANHEDWMRIAPGANTLLLTIVGGGKFILDYYAAFA